MEITNAEFVMSNTDVKKCPAGTFPEYAFIGRSNVGKSMKAYSGNVPAGHFRTSVLLMTNSAFVISILLPFWGFTCGKGSTNFISLHYLCPESEDRLHLSIKNERVHFILHSVCTIFADKKK